MVRDIALVKYIVAISGASGSVYGIRLIRELLIREQEVHIIVSEPARLVIKHELGWDLSGSLEGVLRSKLPSGHMYFYDNQNIAAPLASGSFISRAMIVMPCSMACLSGIATGNARNLIERAADVMLKERRKLILVPRETPLHSVHLRNMLTLSELGAHLIPAMPAFYHHPRTLEDIIAFMVGKVMDALNIEHNIYQRYQYEEEQ
ncbi:MAG: UbiX family flavin prenyltransferase [Syntrophomonadaceae bacterium]|jgi:4-hydroxy-3-polyprenylbenzoate decarboxylase|nr:UbiX family flavin prenyltransferase [Syntrophomonadaceae bacterium]